MPLVKGSPEAKAWAKKMKKARIRAAGKRTEAQFFGPGGEFEDEAAAKRRTNPTRGCTSWEQPSWRMIVNYIKQEGWKPLGKKGVAAFGRRTRDLQQTLKLEARAWRVLYRVFLHFGPSNIHSLGTYKQLDSALIAANRQMNDYLQKKNPGRPHGTFRSCVRQVSRQRPKVKDPKAVCGAALNPITIIGNPPKRIRSDVAGVMYNRVWEVQAEKTGDKHKGFWYHPFKAKSDVQMLALDNGDLLIHSQAGKKLWRED